ncbi:MAG: hypothetical protein IPI77_19515 [Saprospiraceae bacterium]|nr:hypothetical protein [Saprospiraceae bacterium]
MHQVNLFADDFKVRTSDRNDPYPVTPGLFYSGHVKNDPKSLVSFSIFEGEVNGIFSLPELGDIALVKTTSAEDEYMVFSDNDLTGTPDKFECLNQDNDTKLNKIRSQVEQHLEERGMYLIDFEFDDEIYKDFGSNITTVTTGLLLYLIISRPSMPMSKSRSPLKVYISGPPQTLIVLL